MSCSETGNPLALDKQEHIVIVTAIVRVCSMRIAFVLSAWLQVDQLLDITRAQTLLFILAKWAHHIYHRSYPTTMNVTWIQGNIVVFTAIKASHMLGCTLPIERGEEDICRSRAQFQIQGLRS